MNRPKSGCTKPNQPQPKSARSQLLRSHEQEKQYTLLQAPEIWAIASYIVLV